MFTKCVESIRSMLDVKLDWTTMQHTTWTCAGWARHETVLNFHFDLAPRSNFEHFFDLLDHYCRFLNWPSSLLRMSGKILDFWMSSCKILAWFSMILFHRFWAKTTKLETLQCMEIWSELHVNLILSRNAADMWNFKTWTICLLVCWGFVCWTQICQAKLK